MIVLHNKAKPIGVVILATDSYSKFELAIFH
jgi:hypothetical protein